MLTKIIHQAWRFWLDCIFPIRCLGGCGRYDAWLCDACQRNIGFTAQPECPSCRLPQPSSTTCPVCASKTALTGLIVRADYQQPLVQACLHALKYNFIEALGERLGKDIAQTAISQRLALNESGCKPIVIPAPLHWQRKNERGFNQAEVIAKAFSQALDWPLRTDILRRTRYTTPQVRLSRQERLKNLTSVFRVNPGVVISGQTVILIDDVATTTATLEACAQALRRVGVKAIWGAVFARTKM